MPLNTRLDAVGDYSFDRLRALLGGIEPPAGVEPIALSLGEPQHAPPPFLAETVARESAGWSKYPLVRGTDPARTAISDWLTRRYALPKGLVDPDSMVVPVSGTREALFMIALAAVPEQKNGQKPVVLMPNPFYQVYLGAAVTAGAEPVLVPADRQNGFLPNYAALPDDVLDRTALAYYCSPANPQGAIAPMETMKTLVELARAHDFLLVSDECYSELYYGAAPTGAAEACAALGDGPGDAMRNVVAMNSLSKRSSAPGLRSGFVAGDPDLIRRFARLRDYGGAPPPLPLLAAASALWSDEEHVIANRALYAANTRWRSRFSTASTGITRPKAVSICGSTSAMAKLLRALSGARPACGSYPANISRVKPTDTTPAPAISVLRLFTTSKQPVKR